MEPLPLTAIEEDEPVVVNDESESPRRNQIEAISILYFEALDKLKTLSHDSENFQVEGDLDDIRSRLSIWAGNHGAHRPQTDRLSLDHRLREALELHQEVRNHFTEFIRGVDDGKDFIFISGALLSKHTKTKTRGVVICILETNSLVLVPHLGDSCMKRRVFHTSFYNDLSAQMVEYYIDSNTSYNKRLTNTRNRNCHWKRDHTRYQRQLFFFEWVS